MDFIQLADYNTYGDQKDWYNMSMVRRIGRMAAYTRLHYSDGSYADVIETPEEIFNKLEEEVILTKLRQRSHPD